MNRPKSLSLPAVRVEPRLYEALTQLSAEQQRSMSAIIRAILRESLRESGRL